MTWEPVTSRKWRNWQTRKPQKLVLARAWGFKSPLPHHIFLAILAVMKKGGDDRRPLRPICSTIVPRFGKNSLQLSR
ncbi:uncharacterized protein METZ01_LOCUS73491, partial [marine metagenome]